MKKWRLLMAPQKCNYIIFTSDKSSNSELNTLEIKLLGINILACEDPTFLGIRFDKHLTFKNQLNYLKDSCLKRLNVLKVLSNKSWGLSTKTLSEVYNTLIRSLMDYSSIVYPCISVTNLKILEKIQFKCLKIINRKSKYASNSEISSLSGYVSIEERFDELNLKYIKKNINNNNELLIDLYNDYLIIIKKKKS